jgi:Flp pilus assembly protein TadD
MRTLPPRILFVSLLPLLFLGSACASTPGDPHWALPADHADGAPRTFDEEMMLADRLRDSGQQPEAAWHYVRGLQLDNKSPIPRERLGYMQLGRDSDRAQKIFEELVDEHPELFTGHLGLGLSHLTNGDHDRARTSLEKALEIDADSAIAHLGLGMIDDERGAHDVAQDHYLKAVELDPKRYEIPNNLGMSYLMTRDFEFAADAFRHAIFLEPRDPALYNNLAIALAHQGHYRKALEGFRRHSSEGDALNNLGYVCHMNGDFENALRFFERSLLAGPADRVTVLMNMRAAENGLKLAKLHPASSPGGAGE